MMEALNTGFEKLILVCLNERADPRASCLPRGAAEVHSRLKEWVKGHGLSARVRVSKSGCLDQCSRGITVVVLPEFCWYGGVTPDDVERIAALHLAGLVRGTSDQIEAKEQP
jgi:(2Fe-2S) ferredoxin